jgi:hypothetical protein
MIFLIIYLAFIDGGRESLDSCPSHPKTSNSGNMNAPEFEFKHYPHMLLNLTKNASLDALR